MLYDDELRAEVKENAVQQNYGESQKHHVHSAVEEYLDNTVSISQIILA